MRFHLIIILLFWTCVANAGVLNGYVTEAQTGKAIQGVTVVNIATQQAVYTDEKGYFSLPIEHSGQVVFSYIGYKTVQKYISEDELTKVLRIAMPVIRYELTELVLRPKYTPYQMDSLHRRSVYKRTLVWKRTRNIMSPISLLADRLSHKSKERYQFQKNYNRWEDEKFIDTRYTPELVETMTGLTGDSIGYFMNANPMPYDFARAATDLELKMWIRYYYRLWLKNPVIPNIDSPAVPIKQ